MLLSNTALVARHAPWSLAPSGQTTPTTVQVLANECGPHGIGLANQLGTVVLDQLDVVADHPCPPTSVALTSLQPNLSALDVEWRLLVELQNANLSCSSFAALSGTIFFENRSWSLKTDSFGRAILALPLNNTAVDLLPATHHAVVRIPGAGTANLTQVMQPPRSTSGQITRPSASLVEVTYPSGPITPNTTFRLQLHLLHTESLYTARLRLNTSLPIRVRSSTLTPGLQHRVVQTDRVLGLFLARAGNTTDPEVAINRTTALLNLDIELKLPLNSTIGSLAMILHILEYTTRTGLPVRPSPANSPASAIDLPAPIPFVLTVSTNPVVALRGATDRPIILQTALFDGKTITGRFPVHEILRNGQILNRTSGYRCIVDDPLRLALQSDCQYSLDLNHQTPGPVTVTVLNTRAPGAHAFKVFIVVPTALEIATPQGWAGQYASLLNPSLAPPIPLTIWANFSGLQGGTAPLWLDVRPLLHDRVAITTGPSQLTWTAAGGLYLSPQAAGIIEVEVAPAWAALHTSLSLTVQAYFEAYRLLAQTAMVSSGRLASSTPGQVSYAGNPTEHSTAASKLLLPYLELDGGLVGPLLVDQVQIEGTAWLLAKQAIYPNATPAASTARVHLFNDPTGPSTTLVDEALPSATLLSVRLERTKVTLLNNLTVSQLATGLPPYRVTLPSLRLEWSGNLSESIEWFDTRLHVTTSSPGDCHLTVAYLNRTAQLSVFVVSVLDLEIVTVAGYSSARSLSEALEAEHASTQMRRIARANTYQQLVAFYVIRLSNDKLVHVQNGVSWSVATAAPIFVETSPVSEVINSGVRITEILVAETEPLKIRMETGQAYQLRVGLAFSDGSKIQASDLFPNNTSGPIFNDIIRFELIVAPAEVTVNSETGALYATSNTLPSDPVRIRVIALGEDGVQHDLLAHINLVASVGDADLGSQSNAAPLVTFAESEPVSIPLHVTSHSGFGIYSFTLDWDAAYLRLASFTWDSSMPCFSVLQKMQAAADSLSVFLGCRFHALTVQSSVLPCAFRPTAYFEQFTQVASVQRVLPFSPQATPLHLMGTWRSASPSGQVLLDMEVLAVDGNWSARPANPPISGTHKAHGFAGRLLSTVEVAEGAFVATAFVNMTRAVLGLSVVVLPDSNASTGAYYFLGRVKDPVEQRVTPLTAPIIMGSGAQELFDFGPYVAWDTLNTSNLGCYHSFHTLINSVRAVNLCPHRLDWVSPVASKYEPLHHGQSKRAAGRSVVSRINCDLVIQEEPVPISTTTQAAGTGQLGASSSDSGSPPGWVLGLIGAVAGLVILVIASVCLLRQRSRRARDQTDKFEAEAVELQGIDGVGLVGSVSATTALTSDSSRASPISVQEEVEKDEKELVVLEKASDLSEVDGAIPSTVKPHLEASSEVVAQDKPEMLHDPLHLSLPLALPSMVDESLLSSDHERFSLEADLAQAKTEMLARLNRSLASQALLGAFEESVGDDPTCPDSQVPEPLSPEEVDSLFAEYAAHNGLYSATYADLEARGYLRSAVEGYLQRHFARAPDKDRLSMTPSPHMYETPVPGGVPEPALYDNISASARNNNPVRPLHRAELPNSLTSKHTDPPAPRAQPAARQHSAYSEVPHVARGLRPGEPVHEYEAVNSNTDPALYDLALPANGPSSSSPLYDLAMPGQATIDDNHQPQPVDHHHGGEREATLYDTAAGSGLESKWANPSDSAPAIYDLATPNLTVQPQPFDQTHGHVSGGSAAPRLPQSGVESSQATFMALSHVDTASEEPTAVEPPKRKLFDIDRLVAQVNAGGYRREEAAERVRVPSAAQREEDLLAELLVPSVRRRFREQMELTAAPSIPDSNPEYEESEML
ncbi:uncharacterized protein MONBRDRAFT_28875 [Monosiga brevicollis MX1]|uniref:Uncharacterized protein n=1 Tax=Monosiga brevicollis TaxID=81824 RepID=A9V9B4_MONBE|nr:uncharacterized protein MONBRDRAFT_28875 [Monosiga brevicollis MX1]EDQ85901.1 predicted protein [Monosiga brevicollis MX1]|eukprot:XP_001749380.1 hypothetical protein [Monosiga brevicollis MX1]